MVIEAQASVVPAVGPTREPRNGMRRVKTELLLAGPPATTTGPHCGGLLGRCRAPDLDRVLDWLIRTCLACAGLFRG
jgi:hypothetical protein